MSDEVFSSEEGHPDQIFCACGEAWFEGAVVAFEKDGHVNGISGFLRCSGCGEPFVMPHD